MEKALIFDHLSDEFKVRVEDDDIYFNIISKHYIHIFEKVVINDKYCSYFKREQLVDFIYFLQEGLNMLDEKKKKRGRLKKAK